LLLLRGFAGVLTSFLLPFGGDVFVSNPLGSVAAVTVSAAALEIAAAFESLTPLRLLPL